MSAESVEGLSKPKSTGGQGHDEGLQSIKKGSDMAGVVAEESSLSESSSSTLGSSVGSTSALKSPHVSQVKAAPTLPSSDQAVTVVERLRWGSQNRSARHFASSVSTGRFLKRRLGLEEIIARRMSGDFKRKCGSEVEGCSSSENESSSALVARTRRRVTPGLSTAEISFDVGRLGRSDKGLPMTLKRMIEINSRKRRLEEDTLEK
ncbi:hypothetical protein B0O80DRAFT_438370, partial [Mortierella sp. GBAus27b]